DCELDDIGCAGGGGDRIAPHRHIAVGSGEAHVDVLSRGVHERLGKPEEEALDARRAVDDVDDRRDLPLGTKSIPVSHWYSAVRAMDPRTCGIHAVPRSQLRPGR